MRETQQHRLENDTRIRALAQSPLGVELRHLCQHAQQVARGKMRGHLAVARAQVVAHFSRFDVAQLHDHQRADGVGQTTLKLRQVVAFVVQPVDKAKDFHMPALGDDIE